MARFGRPVRSAASSSGSAHRCVTPKQRLTPPVPALDPIKRERGWLFAGIWLGLTLLHVSPAGAQPTDALRTPTDPPSDAQPAAVPSLPVRQPPANYVGDLSCSSTSCHGSPVARPSEGRRSEGAARIWLGETTPILASQRAIAGADRRREHPGDPHAHAWRRLIDVKYQTMLRAASGREDRAVDPAVAARCAACHDPLGLARQTSLQTAPEDPNFSRHGIGCETCHGPASQWLHLHYQHGIDRATLRSAGMIDTKDVLVRARLCSTCHIGSPQHDLDHDLMAVGHPPLQFELTAYHAAIRNPHWDDAGRRREQPTYEAQLWTAGRLAAAEASLHLLAHRAQKATLLKDKSLNNTRENILATAWPPWAEHNCLACHQSLRPVWGFATVGSPRPRQPGTLRQGVPLQSWNRALVPELLARLASRDPSAASRFVTAYTELVYVMEADWIPDPAEVARRAAASQEAFAAAMAAIAPEDSWGSAQAPCVTAEDLLAVVEQVFAARAGNPRQTDGSTTRDNHQSASRPQTDWEQACHVLLALAAARQALLDAAAAGEPIGAAPEGWAAGRLSIPEEVQRAEALHRAAKILRMGPQPGWSALLVGPEELAADRALILGRRDEVEVWSQLAALHRALLAATRQVPASSHSQEVRP